MAMSSNLKTLWFLGFLIVAFGTQATTPVTQVLLRENIQSLKIISAEFDHIHFYITDTTAQKFRIGALTQPQAESILAHFKNNTPLTIQTVTTQQGYLEVTSWK